MTCEPKNRQPGGLIGVGFRLPEGGAKATSSVDRALTPIRLPGCRFFRRSCGRSTPHFDCAPRKGAQDYRARKVDSAARYWAA